MNEFAFIASYAVFFVGIAIIAYWTTTLDRPKRDRHHPAAGE